MSLNKFFKTNPNFQKKYANFVYNLACSSVKLPQFFAEHLLNVLGIDPNAVKPSRVEKLEDVLNSYDPIPKNPPKITKYDNIDEQISKVRRTFPANLTNKQKETILKEELQRENNIAKNSSNVLDSILAGQPLTDSDLKSINDLFKEPIDDEGKNTVEPFVSDEKSNDVILKDLIKIADDLNKETPSPLSLNGSLKDDSLENCVKVLSKLVNHMDKPNVDFKTAIEELNKDLKKLGINVDGLSESQTENKKYNLECLLGQLKSTMLYQEFLIDPKDNYSSLKSLIENVEIILNSIKKEIK